MFSTRIQTESRLQRCDWLNLSTTYAVIGYHLESIITEIDWKQLGKKKNPNVYSSYFRDNIGQKHTSLYPNLHLLRDNPVSGAVKSCK